MNNFIATSKLWCSNDFSNNKDVFKIVICLTSLFLRESIPAKDSYSPSIAELRTQGIRIQWEGGLSSNQAARSWPKSLPLATVSQREALTPLWRH